jgi:hypothetical protein
VAVATSKLAELESPYPSTDSKVRLARLLSDITGLPPASLFDSVTHRGYVSKFLENLRRKMSPSKRKFTWRKKLQLETGVAGSSGTRHKTVQKDAEHGVICDENTNGNVSTSSVCCPRGVPACNLCEGM